MKKKRKEKNIATCGIRTSNLSHVRQTTVPLRRGKSDKNRYVLKLVTNTAGSSEFREHTVVPKSGRRKKKRHYTTLRVQGCEFCSH